MNDLLLYLEKIMWLGAHVKETISINTESDIYKKGRFLWRAGEHCNSLFFLKKGTVRIYFSNADGTEHSIQFIKEGNFITDTDSFNSFSPSSQNAVTVTDAELVILNESALKRMETNISRWDKLIKKLLERIKSERIKMRKQILSCNDGEKLRSFALIYPDAINNTRIEDLASYLDLPVNNINEMKKELYMDLLS